MADRAETQSAAAVAMIRPARFAGNAQTAASNRFQSTPAEAACPADAARAELDALAAALTGAGVRVHVLEGRDSPACPDEVFPNNWLSTHADGTLVLYPMMAPSRRLERRERIDETLRGLGYDLRRVVDLTGLERSGQYLEGTGSLVLDRVRRVAYACRSARTDPAAVKAFAERLGYEPVVFDAVDRDGHPVYHTNVMMSVGTEFAVVCGDSIRDRDERRRVLDDLAASGRDVIDIGFDALHAFAGNLLELRGQGGPVIALSTQALDALDDGERRTLERHGRLVAADIETIETHGGGSVRCMLAELFLPRSGG